MTLRFHLADAQCGMAERRLLNDLMEYYQKLERPVANESEAVQLKERRLYTIGITGQAIANI